MIAPPWYTVPPAGYGGVETVVADLVDALVDRGHHVTLVGAGEAGTKAQSFLSTFATPPGEKLGEALPEVVHTARVGQLLDDLDVDLVHDHTLAGPLLARGRCMPTVVTAHGPVTGPEGDYYRELGDTVGLIAISEAQRAPAPSLPWLATAHNGVHVDSFPFRADKEDYALFLGRFHPQKAPHLAIDAARACGVRVVLAGKCQEPIEREYFDREIRPRLGSDVHIFGVADAAAKRGLLAAASCLLFPICWEEPFGMVMIEAMACGTPVVALRRGSVPEIVRDGLTGAIADTPEQLPSAMARIADIDPIDCRAHVATHFNVDTMAARYEIAYARLLSEFAESGQGRRVHRHHHATVPIVA
jgi:glycosyltransferase involved in cell wall biosynthesis